MAQAAHCELVLLSTLMELIRDKKDFAFVYCKSPNESDGGKVSPAHISIVADDTPLENFLSQVQPLPLPSEPVLLVCYEANGVHKAAHVWWRLKSLGRQSVTVLEGGTEACKQFQSSTEAVPIPVPPPGPFHWAKIDHYIKTETEVEEQKSVPGWDCQVIVTERNTATSGLHFEPNLVFTSIGRFEEPGFLREIVATAGIDLCDSTQSIVFGENAATVLLALAILGKRNLCLGVLPVHCTPPQSPRVNFSIDEKDEFFTACGDDEFVDALTDSRRESLFLTADRGGADLSPSTTAVSAPKTDLKRLQPNSGRSAEQLFDEKTTKSCQCLLM